jgi:hypothetical protein
MIHTRNRGRHQQIGADGLGEGGSLEEGHPAESELSNETRLVIAAQIRLVLLGETRTFARQEPAAALNASAQLEHAPPGLVPFVTA